MTRSGAGGPSRGARTVHLLSACFVIVLWGTSLAVTRVAVREIGPITLAFLRFAVAAAVFWPLARRRSRGVRIEPADRLAVFGLGFVGGSLYFAFENYGLVYTTASHGALIMATLPVVTALLDSWVRRRRPGLGVLSGLAATVIGVAAIVSPEARRGQEASLLGDLLILGAVATWVVYTFLAQRLMARYPAVVVTQAAMVVGAVTLLPCAARELALHPLPSPTPTTAAAVLYLGVLCTAVGHVLWNAAIQALGVTLTTNLINGIPLVGVLTGVAVLGEPFTAATAVGGGLILAGVALTTRSERPCAAGDPAPTACS